MKHPYKRSVFGFRITDRNIIQREQEAVADLTLGCKGFTAARRTENHAIGVLEVPAIRHDEVIGQRVHTVIQRLTNSLEKLLRGKGHENCRG